MPHQLPRSLYRARPNLFLPFPRSASSSRWSGTRTETCTNFPSNELAAFQRSVYVRSILQNKNENGAVKSLRTTVHKRQINQETISQQLTTPSVSHVDQFCLTQEHVNCQGAITRPTAKQSNDPNRTQCRLTSIKRNREHQSHECLRSFLTHPSTLPGPPSRETPQLCDIVLMTTQHVAVTTKWNCSPVHFLQRYVRVYYASRKIGVHRRCTFQQNSK